MRTDSAVSDSWVHGLAMDSRYSGLYPLFVILALVELWHMSIAFGVGFGFCSRQILQNMKSAWISNKEPVLWYMW